MRRFGLFLFAFTQACAGGNDSSGAGGSPGAAGAAGGSGGGRAGSGGMVSGGSGGAVAGTSYARDVEPIFNAKCDACHFAGSPTGLDLGKPFDTTVGLVNRLNSWTMARNLVLVVPGQPEMSALIDKVAATNLDLHTEGDPMPALIPPVNDQELEAIRTWITNGAENDDFFAANVAPIFGDGEHLGTRAGKCSYCHSPKAGLLPDLVNPFDPARGVVNVPATLGGGIRVVPGDPEASRLFQKIGGAPLPPDAGAAMPKRFDRLTAAEVETLRSWIREGALNN